MLALRLLDRFLTLLLNGVDKLVLTNFGCRVRVPRPPLFALWVRVPHLVVVTKGVLLGSLT